VSVLFKLDEISSQLDDKELIESIAGLMPAKGDIKTIASSKGIAQLGDAFINFLYSVSRSIAYKQASGCKVSDTVLSNAYRASLLKKKVLMKGDRDKIGDGVEAIIIWAWAQNYLTLKEMLYIITSHLSSVPLDDRNIEKRAAAKAFTNLLDELAKRLEANENN
jgi:hypothetical protein